MKSRGGLPKFADMAVVLLSYEKILGQSGSSLTASKNTTCRTSTGNRCIMGGHVVQGRVKDVSISECIKQDFGFIARFDQMKKSLNVQNKLNRRLTS